MLKKKLLAYSIYYYPEVASTAQLYTELFESLSDDFDITVICAVPCYTGTIAPEYIEWRVYCESHNGVSIVRVPVREFSKKDKRSRIANILDFYRGARKATAELCKTNSFDIVFSCSQPPILGGMLGVFGGKKAGAPFVYGIQDYNPEQTMAVGYAGNHVIHSAMMALDKRSCRESACVIVPGRDLVETLRMRFNGAAIPRCEVINNWADDETIVPLPKHHPKVAAFREKYGLSDKFVVMYSGNLGLYYDLPNIVKVIAGFKDCKDVVFAFVGEGAVKCELQDIAKSEKLENVIFIPYQSKDNLVYSLNAADVHLVTNAKGIKGVSCPSKAYGVLATNVPILGILEPGSEIWKVVEESGCGSLSEAGDYSAIADMLIEVVIQKQTYVDSHLTGRAELESRLSRRSAISKYRSVFKACLDNVAL